MGPTSLMVVYVDPPGLVCNHLLRALRAFLPCGLSGGTLSRKGAEAFAKFRGRIGVYWGIGRK